MSKIAVLLTLAVFLAVQANALPQIAISQAAASGNWELVHQLLNREFGTDELWQPKINFQKGSVRSLQRPSNGHVYGEAEVSFHSSQVANGKRTENKGGHKVINNDGVVTEFDFDPTLYQRG